MTTPKKATKPRRVFVVVNGDGHVLEASVTRQRKGSLDLSASLEDGVRVDSGAGFVSDGPGKIALMGATEGTGIGQWQHERPG